MRIPSCGFLQHSLRQIRNQTLEVYQKLHTQQSRAYPGADRDIARKIRQIDGMILSLDSLYGVSDVAFRRDVFRILHALRTDLQQCQRKIEDALCAESRSNLEFHPTEIYVRSQDNFHQDA